MTKRHLYTWNWIGGGFNQCYAATKREARKKGNAISPNLTIDEKTFRRVPAKWVDAYWRKIPSID